MLAEVVHVVSDKSKPAGTVYLKEKSYYFRVSPKVVPKIKVDHFGFSREGIRLYIKQLITDRSLKEEEKYTGEIVRISSQQPIFLDKCPKRPSDRYKSTVFKGIIVVLKEKKFKKTKQLLKFQLNKKECKRIKISDIVPLVLTDSQGEKRKTFVLVTEIWEDVPKKKRPSASKRKAVDYFYQKREKGYKKVPYVLKDPAKPKPTEEKVPPKQAWVMRKRD